MIKIFISHSSKDTAIAEIILGWLRRNGYMAFLDSDKEFGIIAGTKWSEQLRLRLDQCRIMVSIISQNYRDSDWCRYEADVAYFRGVKIMPIIIDDCPALEILHENQYIDLKQGHEEARQRLLAGVSHLLSGDRDQDWDAKRRPYPGLDPFSESDELIFFGRGEEIELAVRELRTIRRERDLCFYLVIGASGSGKSSLVRAGVIPQIRRETNAWLILPPFQPGLEPFRELANSFVILFRSFHEQRDQNTIAENFGTNPEGSLVDMVDTLRNLSGEREATLLITIDQVEELLEIHVDHDQSTPRQQFIRCLRDVGESKALAGRVVVIGTLRSDFLDIFQDARHFLNVRSRKQILTSLTHTNFREVIERPAKMAGVDLEDKLVEAMIADTATGDALPLLAFTLRELWDKQETNQKSIDSPIVVTLSEYHRIGGLGGSIQKRAEDIFHDYCKSTPESVLRDCFLSMVRSNAESDQIGCVKKPTLWSELPVQGLEILEHYITARLLVKKVSDSVVWIEPAHEALLRNWKRLSGWIDKDNEYLLWRDLFTADFRHRQQNSAHKKDFLQGAKLIEAEKWKDKLPSSSEERLFIQQSIRRHKQRRLGWYALMSGLALGLVVTLNLWQTTKDAKAYEQKVSQISTIDSDPYKSGIAGLAAMSRLILEPGINYQIARALEEASEKNIARSPRIPTQLNRIDDMINLNNGTIVISGTQAGKASLQAIRFDSRGSVILQANPTPANRETSIKKLFYDADNKLLYSIGGDGGSILLTKWKINGLNIHSSESRVLYGGHPILVSTLQFIPGSVIPGSEPIVAGSDLQGNIIISGRGKTLQTLPGIPCASAFLALGDGSLISAHASGPLRRWKVVRNSSKWSLKPNGLIHTGKDIKSLTLPFKNPEIIIAGGLDGSLHVIKDFQSVQVEDIKTTGKHVLTALTALANGDVITADASSRVRWWRMQQNHDQSPMWKEATDRERSTDQGTINALIPLEGSEPYRGSVISAGAGTLRLLSHDPYSLAQPLVRDPADASVSNAVKAVVELGDGRLVSGYSNGPLCLWDFIGDYQKKYIPKCNKLPEGRRLIGLVSLEQKQIISADSYGSLQWWKTDAGGIHRTGQPIDEYKSNQIKSMIATDDSELITGHQNGALQWRNKRGDKIGSPASTGAGPVHLLIGLGNKRVVSVSGTSDIMRWWEHRKALQPSNEMSKQARVTSLARWSGEQVLAGATDATVQKWVNGKKVGSLFQTYHDQEKLGGVGAMLQLRGAYFGNPVLLTAGEEGKIKIWSSGIDTMRPHGQPDYEEFSTGQEGGIVQLFETGSGDLISGSDKGSLKLISPRKVVKAACKHYESIMNKPRSDSEKEASALCACQPPEHLWDLLRWLCFNWNRIG